MLSFIGYINQPLILEPMYLSSLLLWGSSWGRQCTFRAGCCSGARVGACLPFELAGSVARYMTMEFLFVFFCSFFKKTIYTKSNLLIVININKFLNFTSLFCLSSDLINRICYKNFFLVMDI